MRHLFGKCYEPQIEPRKVLCAVLLAIVLAGLGYSTRADENSVVETCKMLAVAQKEYHSTPGLGDGIAFAQRFISDKDHDGLFSLGPDEDKSPIGFSLALAGIDSPPASGSPAPAPYDGYFFRILTAQGKNAPGGAKNYISDGKLVLGFAFLAYPSQYPSSGVMTFIINQDGVVYRKDLGPETGNLAQRITVYDPDSSWQRAEPDPILPCACRTKGAY